MIEYMVFVIYRFEKSMWKPQFDPMSLLNRSLSTLDITKRKEPIGAHPTFPSFYHKPKSKVKKPLTIVCFLLMVNELFKQIPQCYLYDLRNLQ
jgi:hypothetical protein